MLLVNVINNRRTFERRTDARIQVRLEAVLLRTTGAMLHPVPQKRRCEAAANWTGCLAKRVCVGSAVCPQRMDVAMEISWTPPTTPPQPQHQQTHSPSMTQPTAHCCPRCLAGEPGHINHILGLTA